MLQTGSYCVTNELVSIGAIPRWLQDHIEWQAISPISIPEERKNKLMIIYPTEESRKENLSRLSGKGFAFDRKLHQTIDSLQTSLLADLRLPRLLPVKESFNIILHQECSGEAKKLAFPSINPIPEMEWGRGKTSQLVKLHSHLSIEGVAKLWDGPGIHSFRRVIKNLERQIRGTHPDFACSRITEKLSESETPFTLIDVDGIVMLNHPPTLPKSQKELLLSISKHCPIHQLVYPGNFRLGHHGYLLIDQYPIKSVDDLPYFIPIHNVEKGNNKMNVSTYQIQREEHSFRATSSMVRDHLNSNSKSSIIIIDPSLESNNYRWKYMANNLGISMNNDDVNLTSNSLGHWLNQLITLGHGSNSFSLENLRLISLQTIISPFESEFIHPINSEIPILPDQQLLTNLARNEHVLGGHGALRRWLESLSRPPNNDSEAIKKESTQWWLLNLATSLEPLLRGEDKEVLREKEFAIGCYSGAQLPVIKPFKNADKWLMNILKSVHIESVLESMEPGSLTAPAVIHSIIRHRKTLRNMQFSLKHKFPIIGPDWVEEYLNLINSIAYSDTNPKSVSRLRILTPEQALGCTADLVILTNLSSLSWDMRVKKIPFIGDEERHRLNILRPDEPIRKARHFLQHLIFASKETIILDSSLDDASPPSAPIREWLMINNHLTNIFNDIRPISPRDIRQLDGISLQNNQPSIFPPIHADAITIPIDSQLQRERERRQPDRVGTEHYLPEKSRKHIFSIDSKDFSRKVPSGSPPPRDYQIWPVIGGHTNLGKRTPTIDPRPFRIEPTKISVSDSRHGHSKGAEQRNQIWSPSRLHDWLKCPRSGWFTRGLNSSQEELQSEDLDARTHGELLHLVHHDILCKILGLDIGGECFDKDKQKNPINLAKSGLSKEEVMEIALESLDSRAPWLDRTDAVSTSRLRVLTGMDRNQWNDWLANPNPIKPSGRIGTIVEAEFTIQDSMPISIEWDIRNYDRKGIEISLPSELTSPDMKKLPSIRVQGQIDRVGQLPFDKDGKVWVNDAGSTSIAPLKIDSNIWKPRRLIIIRDLKTSESKSAKERQAMGLLEELQLAIYARAWEIAHPGDLVVGAGISLFSHNTIHMLEMSSNQHIIPGLKIGEITDLNSNLFRFTNDPPSPNSDKFRAWLTQRLSVALGVANGAMMGKVHPTPSKDKCGYCSVREICDVRMEGTF
jgi:hypothetical protein|tara:strand:+ start:2922 stop:6494 length:3573 start_codon:yes stop_codon:yes gene_type:complete